MKKFSLLDQALLRLGLIGAGHMGSAMIKGWLQAGFSNINVLDKSSSPLNMPVQQFKIDEYNEFIDTSDLIFIAVRPNNWPEIANILTTDKPKISLMAGVSFKDLMQNSKNWARIMPNLPVAHGQGVIGLISKLVDDSQLLAAIEPLGTIIRVESEQLLHGLTAVTGSGPAWLWHYANEWQQAAIKLGFSQETARKMVLATIQGSISITGDSEFQDLCNAVASVGGTTAAGLKQLQTTRDLKAAIFAADARSKELAQR